jgi:hypothetical protein
MDFIGPLSMDNKFDCILTITDRLGANIRIIPTQADLTAENLAVLFFDNWYCENGLPNNIVCNWDKLFVLHFWKALTKLTGVKLKLSSAYPETDGSSERSNKTVNQMLCFHVKQNQRGWVRALPRIRFQIMNTVNASTKFSGFQLHLGRSPRIIPPMIPQSLPMELHNATHTAMSTIKQLSEARDNLLLTKITQSHHADASCRPNPHYQVGDLVMLSTKHWHHAYKKKGEKRTPKFFPQWDSPYRVTHCHPEASSYTLDIPTNAYPVYHTSELKTHIANDPNLFPTWEFSQPGPILTPNGSEEHIIDEIIDSCRRGRGWQFLVRWLGYLPHHNKWLPAADVNDCEALDVWYEIGGDGPDDR